MSKCHACLGEVEFTALRCPHCTSQLNWGGAPARTDQYGQRVDPNKDFDFFDFLPYFLGALIVISTLYWYGGSIWQAVLSFDDMVQSLQRSLLSALKS